MRELPMKDDSTMDRLREETTSDTVRQQTEMEKAAKAKAGLISML